jgi:hypothetical protein
MAEEENGGGGKWRRRKMAEEENGGGGKWRRRKMAEEQKRWAFAPCRTLVPFDVQSYRDNDRLHCLNRQPTCFQTSTPIPRRNCIRPSLPANQWPDSCFAPLGVAHDVWLPLSTDTRAIASGWTEVYCVGPVEDSKQVTAGSDLTLLYIPIAQDSACYLNPSICPEHTAGFSQWISLSFGKGTRRSKSQGSDICRTLEGGKSLFCENMPSGTDVESENRCSLRGGWELLRALSLIPSLATLATASLYVTSAESLGNKTFLF